MFAMMLKMNYLLKMHLKIFLNLKFIFKNAQYSFSTRIRDKERDKVSHLFTLSTIANGEIKLKFKDKDNVEAAELDLFSNE